MKMNKLSKNKLLYILLLCGCFSCERTTVNKVTNLTEFVDCKQEKVDTNFIKINIDTITLWETDKRRNGLRISPDNIAIDLNLSITNKLEKDIQLHLMKAHQKKSSCFYGYFETNNQDTVFFVNTSLPDSITINRKTVFYGSFGGVLFRGNNRYLFENLFGPQKDYTRNMINLINKMQFKCRINLDSAILINFSPNNKTLLFSNNTKLSNIVPFFK